MKLYVGNLPFKSDEIAVQEWFAEAGVAVERVQLIRDRTTGKSRGFAFVDVDTQEPFDELAPRFQERPLLGRKPLVALPRSRPRTMEPGMRHMGTSGM